VKNLFLTILADELLTRFLYPEGATEGMSLILRDLGSCIDNYTFISECACIEIVYVLDSNREVPYEKLSFNRGMSDYRNDSMSSCLYSLIAKSLSCLYN
jgi:hypothetical protein